MKREVGLRIHIPFSGNPVYLKGGPIRNIFKLDTGSHKTLPLSNFESTSYQNMFILP